ncbi:hypothetical protein MK139_14085, partial [bacterium]|nr:hypothetical protein [bacterium]
SWRDLRAPSRRVAGDGPYKARFNAGFERHFLKRWVTPFATRGQRAFGEDQSDCGAEVILN